MPRVDPLSFYDLAEALIDASDRTEAHERSAASRYYYALMLYLRNNVNNQRFRQAVAQPLAGRESIHSLVQRFLRGTSGAPDEFGARARVAWSGEWIWLLRLREKADYDMGQPWNERADAIQFRVRQLRELVLRFAPGIKNSG